REGWGGGGGGVRGGREGVVGGGGQVAVRGGGIGGQVAAVAERGRDAQRALLPAPADDDRNLRDRARVAGGLRQRDPLAVVSLGARQPERAQRLHGRFHLLQPPRPDRTRHPQPPLPP